MGQPERQPLWMWPNLLSLDAPIVAVLWQDFLARCYPHTLLWPARWLLGLTVWAIYIGDRLLDTRGPKRAEEPMISRFYRRYPKAAQAVLLFVVSLVTLISATRARPSLRHYGLWVAAAALAYLALFAALPGQKSRFWKGFSAAFVFTAGVSAVAWTRLPAADLISPVLAFALLCGANLAVIRFGDRAPRTFLIAVALSVPILLALQTQWHTATAISLLLLGVVSWRGHHVSANARRVLADAALLTPLLYR